MNLIFYLCNLQWSYCIHTLALFKLLLIRLPSRTTQVVWRPLHLAYTTPSPFTVMVHPPKLLCNTHCASTSMPSLCCPIGLYPRSSCSPHCFGPGWQGQLVSLHLHNDLWVVYYYADLFFSKQHSIYQGIYIASCTLATESSGDCCTCRVLRLFEYSVHSFYLI